MIDIRGFLSAERVTDLKSTTKEGAILELVALAAESPAVEDAEKLQEAIFERPRSVTSSSPSAAPSRGSTSAPSTRSRSRSSSSSPDRARSSSGTSRSWRA